MNKRNYALVLVFASLTLIAGMVFLFDALDIAFEGAIAKWYLILMLYMAAGCIGTAIIRNAPIYYTVTGLFIGVYLSMSFNKNFTEYWALIPISISIGMMITQLVSHGRFKYLKAAIILLILSIIMLIGGITHSWRYVIPAELIAVGLITIIYVSVKLCKKSIPSSRDEEDYHIRPSKENQINKKEDL